MAGPASVARDQLRAFVERIERLEEEIKAINGDKTEVYAEAKANGYDVKALKAVIAKRRKSPEERSEEEAMIDLYMHALGMVPDGDSIAGDEADVVISDARTREEKVVLTVSVEDRVAAVLAEEPRAPARERKPKGDPKQGNASTACYHSDKVINGPNVECGECGQILGPADDDLEIPAILRRPLVNAQA